MHRRSYVGCSLQPGRSRDQTSSTLPGWQNIYFTRSLNQGKFQNFDYIKYVEPGTEEYYGGSVALADYCPYIQEFTWRSKNVIVRGSHCQYAENNPSKSKSLQTLSVVCKGFTQNDVRFVEFSEPDKNFALEKYGENSRCFEHTNQMWEERSCRQMRQWQHWGSGCYGYECQNGRLHILVCIIITFLQILFIFNN
jgi:leishmanolysin-like peptidase